MITSTQNPKIQRVRELVGRARNRAEAGAFVVEGVRLVEEALASGWAIQLALVGEKLSDRGLRLAEGLRSAGVEIETVSERVIQSISETETTQGILAVLTTRSLPLPLNPDFLVLADSIRDPGNLGTLLRTSAAAGAQGVFLGPGTTDPFAPKVLRSAMGAHFRLPIQSLAWENTEVILKSQANPLRVYVADMDQGVPYWKADLACPCAILVGSEAEGASPAARQIADEAIHIPMPGQSESLNAAVAAAILLFEVVRQRAAKSNS